VLVFSEKETCFTHPSSLRESVLLWCPSPWLRKLHGKHLCLSLKYVLFQKVWSWRGFSWYCDYPTVWCLVQV
jgi:hypothetical protein